MSVGVSVGGAEGRGGERGRGWGKGRGDEGDAEKWCGKGMNEGCGGLGAEVVSVYKGVLQYVSGRKIHV